VAVSDEAILEAQREAGRRAGLFGEPAAAAALAGLRQAVADGIVGRRASALAVLTGSGLKDVRAALRAGGAPTDLSPDDDALDEHLRERPLGLR
jgi:threonine synthase